MGTRKGWTASRVVRRERPTALILEAEPVTHSIHKWTGLLNVPYEISIQNSRD